VCDATHAAMKNHRTPPTVFFYYFCPMQLIEVNNPILEKAFIEVNIALNKNTPNYIRPLDKDVYEVFNKKKNKAFRQGECIRWILKDVAGNYAGRIAAFINKKYKNKGDDGPVGGIGFFDCINDAGAAALLFDTAKNWLQQKGMTAMDGPINFGERDRWWGLVTEGFMEPLYCMNFNPPYYKQLFEQYGFQPFYYQICFGLDPKKPLIEKVFKRHELLAKDPGFTARHIRKNALDIYAQDFTTVYNKAWAGHGGLKELKLEQVKGMFNKMKPVMDERIVWFAYYKEEPIALFVNLPDLNQYFKHLNGQFGLLQKLRFLWLQKTSANKKFNGLVFGVVPQYQGMGVDSFMIAEAAKIIQPHTSYTEYEMQWIGDFNPKMLNIAESIGETFRSRQLTTYRFLFDRTKEFKRHPILL
jgi:hypothetical protein